MKRLVKWLGVGFGLFVVAIIAILAAIAVPNFLEAQTRSKVARSLADMRSLATAIEAYRVDDNKLPPCDYHRDVTAPKEWWGYVPRILTSPIAYITSLPMMPFVDDGLYQVWINLAPESHTKENQTYTYVWDITPFTRRLPVEAHYMAHPNAIAARVPASYDGPGSGLGDFIVNINKAGYLLYNCGPDRIDSTVWLCPSPYDASNGTTSFGDVYYFGSGYPEGSGIGQHRAHDPHNMSIF